MNALNTTKEIFATLRRLDPDLPLLTVETLLLVASNPGLTQVEIATKLSTTTATASRTLADILMIRHGLVRQQEDMENRRFKHIYLTPKGERFVAELVGLLPKGASK